MHEVECLKKTQEMEFLLTQTDVSKNKTSYITITVTDSKTPRVCAQAS